MGVEHRAVCLAAGMLSDVPDPVERIRLAAAAGFDGIGLRPQDDAPGSTDPVRISSALAEHDLLLLDVEVVILTSDDRHAAANSRATATAIALRPRHLVVVSFDPDRSRTLVALQQIVAELEGTGVSLVLEFLPFSAVPTLTAAVDLINDVDPGRAGVLVDVLHLVRSGGRPDDLRTVPPALLPALQVCDAPAAPPPDQDRGALFREATGARLLPGDGGLPVLATVSAMPPDAPLSVEVLSAHLMSSLPPDRRIARAHTATRAMLRGSHPAGPLGRRAP